MRAALFIEWKPEKKLSVYAPLAKSYFDGSNTKQVQSRAVKSVNSS
jgi:hypothetical protein